MKNLKRLVYVRWLGILAAALWASGAFAQPTNYCNPTNWEGMSYYYCYPSYLKDLGYDSYYNGTVKRVQIACKGKTILDAQSPDYLESCYQAPQPGNIVPELMPGRTYTIKATAHIWSYGYQGITYCYPAYYTIRIFIDWNIDGDFSDPGEWINDPNGPYNTPGWSFYGESCIDKEVAYEVLIPPDQKLGKTRMRVMSSYWYPTEPYNAGPNACHNGFWYPDTTLPMYVYDYGETEDHILEFGRIIKKSFPGDEPPNNLLAAGQLYDGTTRKITVRGRTFKHHFDKPWVKLVEKPGDGATMSYRIQGPLPSTNVVYEGLDPVTGSTTIDLTDENKSIDITRSRGLASPTKDGSMIFIATGQYRLTIGLAEPNSPTVEDVSLFTGIDLNDIPLAAEKKEKENASDIKLYPYSYDSDEEPYFDFYPHKDGYDPTAARDEEIEEVKPGVITHKEEPKPGNLAIGAIAPNPASSVSQFEVSGEGHATIELYDASGARVMILFDGELSASANAIRIDATGLASGNYSIVIKNGVNAEVRNLTVVK
ncbi:MAG: T9SS type A sorting domain-containing protein [Chloroflexota bacterium]